MKEQLKYEQESLANIERMDTDEEVKRLSQNWINKTGAHRYVYNWHWLGLPVIQLPQDIVASQELIWKVKPTLIIETGVARGGSLTFYASQLALLDLSEHGVARTDGKSKRRCLGIDIEIRAHNKEAIEKHPLASYIKLYQGSSISQQVIDFVKSEIKPDDVVMVILDSNHTYEHVKQELELYSPLISSGSYIVVHDTGIEFAPEDSFPNRDWGIGNNPHTAVKEFVSDNQLFHLDSATNAKLLITSSPDGYIKRK